MRLPMRCRIGFHKPDFSTHDDRVFRHCRKCGRMHCWDYETDAWVLLYDNAVQYLSGRGAAELRVLAIKPMMPFNYYGEEEIGIHGGSEA